MVDKIPDVLPGITLSDEQWSALQTLERFLEGSEKLHLLTGYAGTGKTTLLQALVTRLRQKGDDRPVVLTAFSNKATKVLRAMATQWQLQVDCMTCCRLLGLKPDIDVETGDQVFKSVSDQLNQVPQYRLIIVDECSMINKKMWELLVDSISRLDLQAQMLFVGDPAQLPPVNETESLCFRQIVYKVSLSKVIRYGGAIGLIAEEIRHNIDNQNVPRFITSLNNDQTEGVVVCKCSQWQSLMLKAFASEKYRENPNYVRVLAYTNRRVGELNHHIRNTIYGSTLPRFVTGERLIANHPCLEDGTVIMQTSEECEIIDITQGKVEEWPVWFLYVQTDAGNFQDLVVLHEDSYSKYQQNLQQYFQEKEWKVFWELKQLFHDVSYAYSLTVHKSQGSTFENVFVDVPNLIRN